MGYSQDFVGKLKVCFEHKKIEISIRQFGRDGKRAVGHINLLLKWLGQVLQLGVKNINGTPELISLIYL